MNEDWPRFCICGQFMANKTVRDWHHKSGDHEDKMREKEHENAALQADAAFWAEVMRDDL